VDHFAVDMTLDTRRQQGDRTLREGSNGIPQLVSVLTDATLTSKHLSRTLVILVPCLSIKSHFSTLSSPFHYLLRSKFLARFTRESSCIFTQVVSVVDLATACDIGNVGENLNLLFIRLSRIVEPTRAWLLLNSQVAIKQCCLLVNFKSYHIGW
jgi:hypothetical protein